MYYHKICVFTSLFLATFLFQSCSDEYSEITSESFINNSRQKENNPEQRQESAIICLEWMNLFLELDRYASGMRPNATARAIAYINLAVYETVIPNSKGFISNQNQLEGLEIEPILDERKLLKDIAINKTYSIVIDHFLLNLPNEKRSLINDFYSEVLNRGKKKDSQKIAESEEWGRYVAYQVIAFAESDLAAEAQILSPQPISYIPPNGPGYWTFSANPERALFPYWSEVRTFVVSPEETSTIPPITFSNNHNSQYYQQMMEVYLQNNEAKEKDNEQLWIAEFWSDDVENLVFSPPARQISIANQVIQQKNMNLEDAAYLYLKLGFALNDAAVTTWKYKYKYMVMRPSVFIQNSIDESFQTNLYRLIPWPNPTFPSYPSGHSAFASAAAGVFIDAFGDQIEFTDESHKGRIEFRGKPRAYSSFSQMAEENGYSRIPLGVHMRMDCTEGLRLGYEISNGINNYNLKKKSL